MLQLFDHRLPYFRRKSILMFLLGSLQYVLIIIDCPL